MSAARDLLVGAAMALYRRRVWRPLDVAAEDPSSAQRNTLRRILQTHAETTFGRAHGFVSCATPTDYAVRVPVSQYEDLRPYVERQRLTGERALTADAPVFYAQTSGSTGAPKYVPITPSLLALTRTEQQIFSCLQHRACPAAFRGRTLGIMGAAVEGRLDSGHVVGSVSGHLYQSMPRVVRSRFLVPPEVSSIPDYEQKYLVMLRLALEADDLTYMGAPNPSSFLRLGSLLATHREALTRSLRDGTLAGLATLPPDVGAAIVGRITPQPARAAALDRLSAPTFAQVWPRLAMVTTWTGGSCGVALDTLRTTLPPVTAVMELGYQSTEFRGTLALDAEMSGGLVPLHHTYLEFVEDEAWQRGERQTIGIAALERGRRYQVLVTTQGGLYRYFMNDLVEVAGQHRATPLIRFVQKGRGVTSLTGEKLYEAQVIEAMRAVARATGLDTSFYMLVADDAAARYTAYVAAPAAWTPPPDFAAQLDAAIGERNLEFQGKRASGRLGPTAVVWLRPEAAETCKAAAVAAGQREGQFKPTILQYARDLKVGRDALERLAYPTPVTA